MSLVSATYLIGADGAHSIVRKTLGLTYQGEAYPQGFLLADCKIDWPLDYDHMKLFLRGRHFAVYLPLRGKDMCRVIAIMGEQPAAASPGSREAEATSAEPISLDEVQTAFREACGPDVTLHDAVWTTRYRIHHRGVNKYREGRVFVAGDAAHIHSPAGGQGMNTGLQDAANLAWKLAAVIKGERRIRFSIRITRNGGLSARRCSNSRTDVQHDDVANRLAGQYSQHVARLSSAR